MIRYLKRDYRKLSRDDLIRLRRLTFRKYDSGFKAMMDGQWGDLDTCTVVIAKDTETGAYVGWSAVTQLRGTDRKEIGVFVSWKYRRRGIGTKLIEKGMVFAKADKGRCFMHDDASVAFYRRFGARRQGEHCKGWYGQSAFTLESD